MATHTGRQPDHPAAHDPPIRGVPFWPRKDPPAKIFFGFFYLPAWLRLRE
jgi:hypothetical protein